MNTKFYKNLFLVLFVFISTFFLISGFSHANEKKESTNKEKKVVTGKQHSVASVNGIEITNNEFERSFNNYITQKKINVTAIRKPERYRQYQQEVIDALIENEILWQEAKKENLVIKEKDLKEILSKNRASYPSEDVFKERLKQGGYSLEEYSELIKRQFSIKKMVQKDIVAGINVADEDVHTYYESNSDLFMKPEEVHARHILIKVDAAADEAARKIARKKIESILVKMKEGSNFSELAKKYSEGPSSTNGGDLGFFNQAQMVRPFSEAAFNLKPGEISEVVQTIYGYHIIQMEERRDSDMVSEDEVREELRNYLRNVKSQEALQKKVKQLRADGDIKILMSI